MYISQWWFLFDPMIKSTLISSKSKMKRILCFSAYLLLTLELKQDGILLLAFLIILQIKLGKDNNRHFKPLLMIKLNSSMTTSETIFILLMTLNCATTIFIIISNLILLSLVNLIIQWIKKIWSSKTSVDPKKPKTKLRENTPSKSISGIEELKQYLKY